MTNSSGPQNGAADCAQELLNFLGARRESLSPLLILTHDHPDPDALAAAFALGHLAQSGFGIASTIAYGGEVGRTENRAMVRLLRIPAHKLTPGMLRRHANVALVDTQPEFENNPFPPHRRATLVIDQHPSPTVPDAELALVDPHCGASCAIVAAALLRSGAAIPPRVATALAYGILTDTQDLFRAERPDVVETYLHMLHHCDLRLLARIQNPARSRKFFTTLGKGIRDALMYRRVLISHLGPVETPDLVSQIADFLLAYRQTVWCFVTGRYKGRLHASLRTSQLDAQAGEVLRATFELRQQAGGHDTIAGGSCRIGAAEPDEVWQAKELALQARLLKRLRVPATAEPRRPFLR
ncbi:MAG: DHH family phosphoesterase [Planctomycetes bacterium]|nr:DHH family phosphoesterase [Planctomycetota bacterium]